MHPLPAEVKGLRPRGDCRDEENHPEVSLYPARGSEAPF